VALITVFAGSLSSGAVHTSCGRARRHRRMGLVTVVNPLIAALYPEEKTAG
jgi:hypothetical protein